MEFDKSIEIIKGGIDPLFSNLDLLNEFDSIYFAIFGERIKLCCGKTLQFYFDKLKKYVDMKNQDKKFLLKQGVQMHCNHNVYTNVNLTDEVAIELLNQDARRIANFDKFPENWESLKSSKKTDKLTWEERVLKAQEAKTVQELEAMLESEKSNKVIAAINARIEELQAETE